MEYLTYYETIIWEGINLSDYEEKNNFPIISKKDEINLVYDSFIDEFWHDYNKKDIKIMLKVSQIILWDYLVI